jgi:hypothetical protein
VAVLQRKSQLLHLSSNSEQSFVHPVVAIALPIILTKKPVFQEMHVVASNRMVWFLLIMAK